MEKKIIAIALVLIVIATCFTACKKGEKYIDKDGYEHLLCLDEEGNTILNDEGKLVVYITEPDGKIREDEDGEPMTGYVAFPEQVIKGNTLETPDYKMTLSDEWKLQEDGEFVRKDNEKISIEIIKMGTPTKKGLKELFNEEEKLSDEVVKVFEKEFPVIKKHTDSGMFSLKQIEYCMLEYKMSKEENGPVIYYSNAMYFVYNDQFYQANLSCEDGSYDEALNLYDIINANLVMK